MYLHPSPGFFDSQMLSLPAPNDDEPNYVIDYCDDELTDDKQMRRKCKEELYDNLDEETKPIQVGNGHVTFCLLFKYLGSFISFGLCGDYDIKK